MLIDELGLVRAAVLLVGFLLVDTLQSVQGFVGLSVLFLPQIARADFAGPLANIFSHILSLVINIFYQRAGNDQKSDHSQTTRSICLCH